MEKKYQVFISSTYLDLKEERQKVVEAVLNAGHIPAGMELFHAGDETQKELIEEWINESDIYVLLLGGRYGSIDADGVSYTQWEYNKAAELGKPRFSLVLTEDYLNQKVSDKILKATDLEYNHPALKKFRSEVTSRIVSQISNIDIIEAEVIKSLSRIIKKKSDRLIGWIKGDHLDEIETLKSENKLLTDKLVNRQDEVIDMQKEIKSYKDKFIGEFDFDYICETLNNTLLSRETTKDISDSIELELLNLTHSNASEDILLEKEKLLEQVQKMKSILDWLIINTDSIQKGNIEIRNRSRSWSNIYKEILPNLEKFQLIKLEDVVISRDDSNLTKCAVKFSDKGYKFINLLEMSKGI